ncbi:JmjC domain-containing protein, partial [Phaeosphaeriaceae sp. PMI808]
LPGVNKPYWYTSREANTPAPIRIEDGNTGSANLLLAGAAKHWLIIHRSSVSQFEKCVKQEFVSLKACSQFVRHHNIVVGPDWLTERSISFNPEIQVPGEIMCTLPGSTYHEVHNAGPNFAIAINY